MHFKAKMFASKSVLVVFRRFFASAPSTSKQKLHKASVIDGKAIANKILDDVKVRTDIDKLSKVGVVPKIVAVLVGDVPESKIYVDRKRLAASKIGINCQVKHLPADISQDYLVRIIADLNKDNSVHGVMVQLPLPAHVSETVICNTVAASKDVDGFSDSNLGRLVQGGVGNRGVFVPCTALAVASIIKEAFPGSTKGLRAVVAGRSHNVGLPIALILSSDGSKGGLDLTTSVCHRYTQPDHLSEAVKQADVVVSATGVPGLIRPEFVKSGSFIVDVGISRVNVAPGKSKLFGDVDPGVSNFAGFVTPVPGGVGPCTVACLLRNTVQAAVWSTFQ